MGVSIICWEKTTARWWLLLLRVRLACQNVQHAQSCSGLLRQLRRAAQGHVGLGAEIVGDKNMLNHGGLGVC